MDKRVEIHGTSRADMNGKRGVATDFHWYEDESKWRYTVQLDSGEAFKVKPASLRAEGGAGSPEKLFEMGNRVWQRLQRAVDPTNTGTWALLSASQQEEMGGAILMLQESMDQVSARLWDEVPWCG